MLRMRRAARPAARSVGHREELAAEIAELPVRFAFRSGDHVESASVVAVSTS